MVLFSKDEGALVCEWKRLHILGMGHEGTKARGRKQGWTPSTWTCAKEGLGRSVGQRLRQEWA